VVGERENGKGGLKGRDLSVGNHVYLSASNGTSFFNQLNKIMRKRCYILFSFILLKELGLRQFYI
jgi:hypothetical protein